MMNNNNKEQNEHEHSYAHHNKRQESDHGSHQVHDDHEDHGHHDHGDMVSDFKKRLFISLIITMPILALSPMIQSFLGVDWRFANDQYIVFALATCVFFYGGWP